MRFLTGTNLKIILLLLAFAFVLVGCGAQMGEYTGNQAGGTGDTGGAGITDESELIVTGQITAPAN